MTFADEQAPDAIEPITAYRVWLADGDGRLSSLNGETTWLPATWMRAHCSRMSHAAPAPGCTQGR